MTTPDLARGWFGFPGASAETLEQLRQRLPPRIPSGYLELLALSNGGEGPLPVQPYSCYLDDVATVLAGLTEVWRRDWLDEGFLVIGGNGGGELLAFDLRALGVPPVVAVDMVAGGESTMQVAPTFEMFLGFLGRESED